METIGNRIATFRHSLKWTQDRLAAEVDIPRSILSDIENDKVSPKMDLLDKIAEKLNVTVTQLLPTGNNIVYNVSDHSSGINGTVHNYNNEDNNKAILEVLTKVLETQNRLILMLEKQGEK